MRSVKPLLLDNYQLTPLPQLKNGVEDRRVIRFDHCELNVFETREKAVDFKLNFSEMAITAMVRGKKIMHLFGKIGFDYLPGEMVLVPGGEEMSIDFPEADIYNPTQCLALTIEESMLKETIEQLNEKIPKTELNDNWKIDSQNFHIAAPTEANATLDRLSSLNEDKNIKARNILATLTLKELIIRLMQTQARTAFLENSIHNAGWHRFSYVMEYIKTNLTEKIKVEKLCNIACMSKPNFFKSFKREFGVSPVDMIIKERIKLAKKLLLEENRSVSEACYLSGFNNMSHFFRLFRKEEGLTPKNFKEQLAVR